MGGSQCGPLRIICSVGWELMWSLSQICWNRTWRSKNTVFDVQLQEEASRPRLWPFKHCVECMAWWWCGGDDSFGPMCREIRPWNPIFPSRTLATIQKHRIWCQMDMYAGIYPIEIPSNLWYGIGWGVDGKFRGFGPTNSPFGVPWMRREGRCRIFWDLASQL